MVAVFGFEVRGGAAEHQSLSTGIPDALSEAFLKGGRVRPIERRMLEKLLAEQELSLSGLVDDSTAVKIGKLAGARYALLGSATIIADQVRISCRVVDVETAEILYAKSAYGQVTEIFGVLEALAAAVAGELAT